MAQLQFVDWDGLVYYDSKSKEYIEQQLYDTLKSGGTISFADLPDPSLENFNYIYTIKEAFTAGKHFKNPGYVYEPNTKVIVITIDGVYFYDIFDENQYDSTLDEETLEEFEARFESIDSELDSKQTELVSGKNISTINGKSILDGKDINTEDVCTIDQLTSQTLGGIPQNTNLKGMSFNQILGMLLYDIQEPTITDPSLRVTLDKTAVIAEGKLDASGTITFDRGKISPSNGTSGFRAGKVKGYTISGDMISSEFVACDDDKTEFPFEVHIAHVTHGAHDIHIVLEYEEGEQPLTNHGTPSNIYQKLEAGTLETIISIVGLTAPALGSVVNKPTGVLTQTEDEHLWSSTLLTDSIEDSTKTGIFETTVDSTYETGYQVHTSTPTTYADAPIVELPKSVTLIGIKVWDEMSHSWQWYQGSAENSLKVWTQSNESIYHTIEDNEFEYARYTLDLTRVYISTIPVMFRFVIE